VEADRDYRKFLNEEGRLNVRLLPRSVYTGLVTKFRSDEEVIRKVFEEYYLLWDLDAELERQERAGEERDPAAASQAVLDQLEDADWWRVMSGFEKEFAANFLDNVYEWRKEIDPIYDEQETKGWQPLQP
jgi:hypothetical protein